MIKKYYIYRITNLINGKTYIGQHKYRDLNDDYMGSGKHLKAAQVKYGIENFRKEILVFNISKKEHIDLLEKTFIAAEREKVGVENCYNIADGGEGGSPNRGKHLSEEHKRKLSEAHKGKPAWNKGKKGKPAWNKGKKMSEEFRKKDSEAHKCKKQSEETIRKRVEKLVGKKRSEEQKGRLSEALKGKPSPSKGKHWFTNGKVNIRVKECPEDFRRGICRLNKS